MLRKTVLKERMDEITIFNALNSDPLAKLYFQKTVSCNLLPKLNKNEIYVINDQPAPPPNSHINGTHWLIAHSLNPDQIEVLCSGGSTINDNKFIKKRVLEYCSTWNVDYYYFPSPQQLSTTSACGCYILVYIFFVTRGIFGPEILKKFFAAQPSFERDLTICHIAKQLFYIDKGTVEELFLDTDFLARLDADKHRIISAGKWPRESERRGQTSKTPKKVVKKNSWPLSGKRRPLQNGCEGAGGRKLPRGGERREHHGAKDQKGGVR